MGFYGYKVDGVAANLKIKAPTAINPSLPNPQTGIVNFHLQRGMPKILKQKPQLLLKLLLTQLGRL